MQGSMKHASKKTGRELSATRVKNGARRREKSWAIHYTGRFDGQFIRDQPVFKVSTSERLESANMGTDFSKFLASRALGLSIKNK